jgi:curved DNA-binding protein CbpA
MYPEIAAGVTPWASYEEIRAAFKRRVLETHPDKGQGLVPEIWVHLG